jgi:hypothetical protein
MILTEINIVHRETVGLPSALGLIKTVIQRVSFALVFLVWELEGMESF